MSDFQQHAARVTQASNAPSPARRGAGPRANGRAGEGCVAVIGLGCRFPAADGPGQFWRLLAAARDAVTEVPPDRWPRAAYYSPGPPRPGRMSTRWGGFVTGVEGFDAPFFGVAPREAAALDPQQRLVLEVAWEALEEAGVAADALAGSDTGVFIGVCNGDYAQLHRVLDAPERITPYFGTGNAYSFAAGRLSYLLGLHGPSLAVDTACSSSLVAVHLACQSLRQGECDLALAGGVNLILSPTGAIYVSQVRAVAADGRCKTFDAAADGYVRSEGCGIVVLKRLPDALADGDRIDALILGSAINHDGRSAGLTVPNGHAQTALIRKTLTDAGVEPARVSYVETHGTGTPLGDPIEVRALGEALCQGRRREQPLMLGSVKTNIGHLEAAAGVAGLIKTVLCLRHGQLPPNLHFKTPNPNIPWDELPLSVPTELTSWAPPGGSRVAGVSSFGFSGTNAHVILEEAPALTEDAPADAAQPRVSGAHLLPISARSLPALRALAARYESFLALNPPALDDICHTAALRRAHHPYRLAVVGDTHQELGEHLAAFSRGEERPGCVSGSAAGGRRPRVAFVYSGQGAQWWAMGRQLWADEPAFRHALRRCHALVARASRWPLLDELLADRARSRLDGDDVGLTQVALFSLQVALTELWRSWGVEPDAVVGHSMGEVAAAYACGALSLEQAVGVICARGRLLQSATRQGAMAAVAMSAEQARAAIAASGGGVSVGADNGPNSCVLSGEADAVEEIIGRLERGGVSVRRLRTTGVAGHSPQVEAVRAELEAMLEGLRPSRARIRMASTVTGESVSGTELDAHYWGRNLRETVQFRRALGQLAQEGYRTYLEVGVHPVLAPAVEECLRESGDAERAGGRAARVCWTLQRGEPERARMLSTAAELYAAGCRLNWRQITGGRGRLVSLPRYPWQRQRFWIETPEPRSEPTVIAEDELGAAPRLREVVEGLLQRYPVEGARAVNRSQLAPLIFLGGDGRALFYFSRVGSSFTTLIYVGPEESFESLVTEAADYTRARELQLNLLAEEGRAAALARLGFTTTPFGALQAIPDLGAFNPSGNRMRRLRYQVSRYAKAGGATNEYAPGSDRRIDAEIGRLVDEWLALKGKPAPSVAALKERILAGSLDPHYRIFLTRRGPTLDGAVILSPAGPARGYLMDLEFYGRGVPAGCLEYTTLQVIEQLRAEGCTYLGLGGTYGTRLSPHPNADPDAVEFFAALHREGVLNGDGNFQFKSKFRPQASALYLCRPPGSSPHNLTDVLVTLSGTQYEARRSGHVAARPEAEALSPLVGRRLHMPLREILFESELSATSPTSFVGHRVDGLTLLPGTAYLEMILEAAALVSGAGRCALRDVIIHQPLVLPAGKSRTVQMVLRPAETHEYAFEIFSLDDGEADEQARWRSHAAGVVSTAEASPAAPLAGSSFLEQVKARCREEVSCEEYYARLARQGVDYGPDFRSLEEVRRGAGEALGRAHLRRTTTPEDGAYLFHPALLDACFQVLGVAHSDDQRSGAQTGFYLLKGVEALRVYERAAGPLWSHAVLRGDAVTSDEVLVGDLRLFDETGRVVAEVEGLCARRVERQSLSDAETKQAHDWLYEVRWLPEGEADVCTHASSPAGRHTAGLGAAPGSWLILADERGVGQSLAGQLAARGETCRVARAGRPPGSGDARDSVLNPGQTADFQRLLREWYADGMPGPRRIVHLWSLDAADDTRLSPQRLEEASLSGCGSTLHLIQAAARAPFSTPPRLWLVTRGAQAGGPVSGVAQATLWGLGRVIAAEHPELWGGLIDLGDGSAREEAEALLREITAFDGEDNVAYRGGRRLVARLTRSTKTQGGTREFSLRADASYLVTGGLGGLGLTTAAWMVKRGARHLLLAGRSAPQSRQEAVVERLRLAGAEVSVRRLDVSDPQQVSGLVEEVAGSGAPLRGVVHAAGFIDDQVLLEQTWERFTAVLRPKVRGAWNLHQATRHLPLDFFVLFSSAAALLGPAGQGNHAAANSFMDALAHHRRAQGLTALSVNWGVWSEVGLAAERGVGRRAAALGMGTISPEEGVLLLERMLCQGEAEVAVLPVDWRRWGQSRRGAGAPPLVGGLLGREAARAAGWGQPAAEVASLSSTLRAAGPEQARTLLEQYLREEAARLMGLPAAELDVRQPLNQMGFDSLMSIGLKNRIERDLGVRIPIVSFFRDPSVARLAEQLARELEPAAARTDAEQLLSRLDLISDGEVDSLLAEMET